MRILHDTLPLPYDKQGRITLSPSVEYAGLEKDVLIGMVNKMEVWNPQYLENTEKRHWRLTLVRMKISLEKLQFEVSRMAICNKNSHPGYAERGLVPSKYERRNLRRWNDWTRRHSN